MDIKQVEIEKIKPYENNNKKHPQSQIDNVAKSIELYGFVQPLVIDKKNTIVIGHCRYLAAKQLGLTEVPCVYVNNLSAAEVRKLRILDNKLNESDWDFANLELELAELDFSDFDIDWGGDYLDDENFISDILNDKSFHTDNQDINKTLFVVSFAFPKEAEEVVKPYLTKNKDEITERLIQEAQENASMR